MLYIVYMYMYVYIVCSIVYVYIHHVHGCTFTICSQICTLYIYINMPKLVELAVPVWLQINRCVCRWLRLKLFGICAFNPLLKHVPLYASVHVAFGITDSIHYQLVVRNGTLIIPV